MLDVTKVSRYDVIERIAENAFSVVYRGRDSVHHRPVAIKICIASDAALRQRFLRLAEAAAPLRHPNIVEILEFGSGDGQPYLIEEFLPGGDLRDWIDRGEPTVGERELEILDEIARALEYAHRKGVLHQDLKPATVHLEDGQRVKLVDFGLARLNTAAAKLRDPGEALKSDGYLPPEQALGLPADARTDLYCFGALAYELVSKLPPFPRGRGERMPGHSALAKPEPLTSFWPDCPPAFTALVDRCMALSPGDRYASFEELREDLTPLVEGMKSGRRAHRARKAPRREPPTEAASSLDDTMAIPPDVLLPRAAVSEAGKPAEAKAAGLAEHPLEDTRETTLPLPKEVVEAAAKASAPPPLEAPAGPPPSRMATPVDTLASPAPPPLQPRPQPAAVHAPLASAKAPAKTPPAAKSKELPSRPSFRRLRPGRLVLGFGVAALVLVGLILGWKILTSESTPTPAALPTPAPAAVAASVPSAAPATGLLVIDATPWGQVVRIRDQAGLEVPLPTNRYTPLALAAPPGTYTVELSRAGLEGSRTCTATVALGSSARCLADLEKVGADDFFKEAGWWR